MLKGGTRALRRAGVLAMGLTVVLVGVVMLFTPGPAIVVIPIGLMILAAEFVWARRLVTGARRRSPRLRRYMPRPGRRKRGDGDAPGG